VKVLVIVVAVDPHRQAEALRAALGLTLRGATVDVVVTAPPGTPLAERAAATLRSFGHAVTVGAPTSAALAIADAVEVWTAADEPAPATVAATIAATERGATLHLARRGASPVMAEADWLVDLDRPALADRGTPPLAPGPISHDQLVELLAAATRVITW